jgi:uncharacterized protein (DUF433 family)
MRFSRITRNPDVLAGRAAIRGLRISVAHVVNLVANGMTTAEIIKELPDLEEEDIRQVLAYAAALAQPTSEPTRSTSTFQPLSRSVAPTLSRVH